MKIHSYAAFGISAGIWTLSGTRRNNSIEVTDLPNVVRSSSIGYEVIASRVFLRMREIVPYFPTVSSSSIACGERLGGRGAAPGRRGLVVGVLLSVETPTVSLHRTNIRAARDRTGSRRRQWPLRVEASSLGKRRLFISMRLTLQYPAALVKPCLSRWQWFATHGPPSVRTCQAPEVSIGSRHSSLAPVRLS